MFTDMVGYTALGQRNEELSIALVEEQKKLVRPVLARHNGREVKTMGDAFLLQFPSAVDAVRCAYDIQRAVREFDLSLPSSKRFTLRIGIHVGEVVQSGEDISGDAVNVASRIEPLAEDGGICLTRQTYDQVVKKVDFRLTSLGLKRLKNVEEPVEVFRLVLPWDEEAPRGQEKPDKKRVAILPFASMSPDPSDAYLADGITEEIISTVSGISGLGVISRTSVMRYRSAPKQVKEIGRELEVGSVLEGSFRKSGNRIRVAAQLIDVATDEHVWTQTYDRELDDVFLVQSDIAKQVADALRVKILPREQAIISKTPTASSEAHELYLKGKYFWNQRSRESLLQAVDLFQTAIKLDPKYSLAYSGLADCYGVLGDHRLIPYLEAFSKAKEYALKAVGLDQTSAEAHVSLALALFVHRDITGAFAECERAIALSPSYATAHHWYSIDLYRTGRPREALERGLLAQRLDPLSPQITSFIGLCYVNLGEYELAEKQQSRAFEIQPRFIPAFVNLRYTYISEKKYAEAEAINNEYWKVSKDDLVTALFRALIFALAGREAGARKAMREAEAIPNPENLEVYYVVLYHTALREYERAIELAQQEFNSGANWIGEIAIDYLFSPIRMDPRVQTMLKKVGASPPVTAREI